MNELDYRSREHKSCYQLWKRSCIKCGKPAKRLGFIIPDSPKMISRFGWEFIYSRFNRRPVCEGDCYNNLECHKSEIMLNAHRIWFAMAEENIPVGGDG
jgi:hypothetical protein